MDYEHIEVLIIELCPYDISMHPFTNYSFVDLFLFVYRFRCRFKSVNISVYLAMCGRVLRSSKSEQYLLIQIATVHGV